MRVSNLVRAVAALAFSAGVAQAQLVGTFNGAGSLSASGASGVGQPVQLTFTSPLIAVPTQNGLFSAIPVGSTGTIQNVLVGTGAYSLANFIQIAGFNFSLDFVAPGSFAVAGCASPVGAAGQTCSPPGTPFNLSNLDNGRGGLNTSAAFSLSGILTDASEVQYAYNGIFTAQFTNMSYQELATAIDAGGTLPVAYSVTIEATALSTPEPATFALMGSGLLCLVGVIRVRRSQV